MYFLLCCTDFKKAMKNEIKHKNSLSMQILMEHMITASAFKSNHLIFEFKVNQN